MPRTGSTVMVAGEARLALNTRIRRLQYGRVFALCRILFCSTHFIHFTYLLNLKGETCIQLGDDKF